MMNSLFKKSLVAVAGAAALAAAFAGTASAAGAQHNDNPAGKQFQLWDGNGNMTWYVPSSYHDVVTPSGSETEVFQGVIANDTGHEVVYTAGVGPVPADQTAYSFVTTHTTPNWELTIDASGHYTLTANFHK